MSSTSLSLVLDPPSFLEENFKQTCTAEEDEHYDFISLLGLAQKLDIPFLSITWQPALDLLGEGASAEVYQSTVYKSVALAFKDSMAKKTGKRKMGFKDIMREMLIVRAPFFHQLSPNIITLLGISWNIDPYENRVWPVLVYRKGLHGTLRNYICDQERMEETLKDTVSICSGVLHGLAALHSAGIVHGDLKPENIIIQHHNNYLYAAISDFGFSSISHCDDTLIQIPCSPPWTAPEHHMNKHSFESAKQMDVFSFGLVMLWALLARAEMSDLSYQAQLDKVSALKSDDKLIETARSTFDRIMEPSQREVYDRMYRILVYCLQYDPHLRAKSACEVLSIVLAHLDKSSHPPSFPAQDQQDLSFPTHSSFTIEKSISQLSTADYRVRVFILNELLHRTEHTCDICKEQAKCESVVALKLGFGGDSIHQIHFDSFVFSATHDDGTDTYCSNALQTIKDIAVSSSAQLLLPPLDSEVESLEGLVQADLVHEYQRGRNLEIAINFYNKEIKIRTTRLGKDHSLVLVLQNILLLVYEAFGNPFAAQEISQAIYLSLSTNLGLDHPSTLHAMAQYALQSANAGQPGLSISLGEEFVLRGSKIFDHLDTIYITGFSNLGLAYYNVNRYAEAENIFRAAFEHHRASSVGSNEADCWKILFNLALAIKAQGHSRIQEADQFMLEASVQLQTNLGIFHRDTIWSLVTRAFSWHENLDGATLTNDVVQFHDTVATITKEFLGPQHPDTLVMLANYANCLSASGSWVEAKELYEEVLEALQNVLSDTQLHDVHVTANFAAACFENDELDRAEELILYVLFILRGRLSSVGSRPALVRYALNILMNIYRCREDKEKAEILLMVIWEGIRDDSGDMIIKQNVLTGMENVAVFCVQRGYRVSEAFNVLVGLLEITTRQNGPKDPRTISARNAVAEGFSCQRLYSEAEKMHLETLKICQKEFDPRHPKTLMIMSNLAIMYSYQMKEEQAADLMYQVYLTKAGVCGLSNNDTVCAAGWVAHFRQRAGADYNPNMFTGIFDRCKKLEGTDRDSIGVKLALARSYMYLEHMEEALEIAQGAVRACKRRFGDIDLLTLSAWYTLADTLHSFFPKSASPSQLERAKDIATFVFEEYNKIHGEYHEDTGEAEMLLGIILRDQGLYAEAERHLRHALLVAEMLSGENVYSVISGLMRLLRLYERQGKEESAQIITDRITYLKKEIDENQTLHVCQGISYMAS